MFKKIIFIAAILTGSALPAHADFYFEQNVQASVKDTDTTRTDTNFVRKVYVLDGILLAQIFEKNALKKEYGFDFKKNLYYETDPGTGYYKLFDLALLDAAFENMNRGAAPSFKGTARRRVAVDLAKNMEEGRLDYPVFTNKVFWSEKNTGGRKTAVYKLREGPGGTFLNPFGWYRKAKILATEDVPGFAEYSRIRAQLAGKAHFYKIKNNLISDFIVTISSLDPFPLTIETAAQGRFGNLNAKETRLETASFISTAKIDPQKLLYFKESANFSWNTVFSKGTDFGPEVAMPAAPDLRGILLPFLIPGFFILFAYLWFFGGYEAKNVFSLKRLVVLRALMLFSFLLILEIVHYFTEMPFLEGPFFEFMILFSIGIFWILAETLLRHRYLAAEMREEHLLCCPHCGAPIEEVYLICPKCNSSIK